MKAQILKISLVLFVILNFASQAISQTTLSTSPPLNGGNGQYGVTFEVQALNTVTITQIGIKANVGTVSGAQIWYRPGGVQHITNQPPVVTTANGWVNAGTASNWTSTNATQVVQIPLPLSIVIQQGVKYGFCVTKPASAPTFVYTTMNTSLPQQISDANITIRIGTNSGYGGAAPNPTFHPRGFNGSVTYTIGGPGGSGPVLPPIANFFPNQPTVNTMPNDTLWLNSPSILVSTSQNASRVYWDLPNETVLDNGYFRVPVPFSNQQYIDTAKYNTTLKYTFKQRGFWPVRLLAVNYLKIDSLRDSTLRYVYVDTPTSNPIPDFIAFKRKIGFGEYGNLLDLTRNGPNQWSWSFDPPCNKCNNPPFFPNFFAGPTDQNPLFFGGDPGKYTICLQAWNAKGWDSICKKDYIEVLNSYSVCSGSGSTFTTDDEGYLFAASGPNFSYTRSQITGCQGIQLSPCADSITLYVERLKMLPSDSIEIRNGIGPQAPVIATIGGSSVAALPVKYRAGIRGGRNVFIRYKLGTQAVPPNYDSAGFSIRWDIMPASYPKPTANMDIPDTIYSGQPIVFKSKSVGTLVNYAWDSDGNNDFDSAVAQFSRTFLVTTPQIRNICHVAYNCVGSDTICKTVVFLPLTQSPQVRFEVDKFQGFNTDTFYFRDKSLNGPTDWQWVFTPGSVQFLNGTNSGSANPDVRFTQRTKYTVKLVGTNAFGADSLTQVDYINIGAYDVPQSLTSINQADGSIGISRVQLAGLDTSTNALLPDYEFVTGNQAADLFRGSKSLLTVTRPSTNSAMDRKVWIDFNMDGSFTNDELVMDERNETTLTRSDTIVVNGNQRLGSTRMRVGVTVANTTLNPAIAFLGVFRDYVVNFPEDLIRPSIALLGDSEVFTEINKPYNEPGVIATDNIEGDISNKFEVFGVVNTSQVGPYELKYIVRDLYGNVSDTVSRTVYVVLNQTGPSLTLTGPSVFYSEVYNAYVEPGFAAFDNQNNNITNQVIVSSNVDTATLGSYLVNYSVTDAFGMSTELTRQVNIGDSTRPVITPKLNNQGVYEHQVGVVFTIDDAVDVTDNYWTRSNINVTYTNSVDPNSSGLYNLLVDATDLSGNIANQVLVPVLVVDKVAPTIQLNGLPEEEVEVFNSYNDPGVIVTDNYWPESTILITTNSNLNTSVLGTYFRTYIATDPSGNTDSISRIIKVVDRTIPVIQILGENPVNLPRWQVYTDAGVLLTDNYNTEAELLPNLVAINNLPLNSEGKPFGDVEGLFSVKYDVTDLSGNMAVTAERLINVMPSNGISAINLDKLMSLYPNPATKELNLRLINKVSGNVTAQVLDITGKQILTRNLNPDVLQNQVLDVGGLTPGVYLIQIQHNGKTYQSKFIKQ